MVVGEYGSDYGCFLPNPVSIHRERFRLRLETEWRMQTLQKMKLLGVERSAITIANTIQPREYSRGGGTDGTSHNPPSIAGTTTSVT